MIKLFLNILLILQALLVTIALILGNDRTVSITILCYWITVLFANVVNAVEVCNEKR